MGQVIFPPGIQEAVSGVGLSERFDFGKSLDGLLKLRLDEQANARELFNTIARDNPRLAAFALQSGDLGQRLTKTPSTLVRKGEIPLGQEVRNSFAEASKRFPPSMQMDPDARAKLTLDFGKRIADSGVEGITGDQMDVFMEQYLNTGELGSAFRAAGIDDETAGKMLTSKAGENLGPGAAVMKIMKDLGFSPEQQFEVGLSILMNPEKDKIMEATFALTQQKHALEVQRLEMIIEQFRAGKPLSPEQNVELSEVLQSKIAFHNRNQEVLDSFMGFAEGAIDLDTFKSQIRELSTTAMLGSKLDLATDPIAMMLFQIDGALRNGLISKSKDLDGFIQQLQALMGGNDLLIRKLKQILGTGKEPGLATTPPVTDEPDNGGGDTAASHDETLGAALQMLKDLGVQ